MSDRSDVPKPPQAERLEPPQAERLEPPQAERLEPPRAERYEPPRSENRLPPVELWHPDCCGDIGLRIDRNGVWLQNGVPIRRAALTRLFSTILRRDPDRYVLVTPAEMVEIEVEDAPFLAVELLRLETNRGPALAFRTNVDDWVTAGPAHPIRFERDSRDGVKPYVNVRGGLWALVSRALQIDLLECAECRDVEGRRLIGLTSCGSFFPIGPADDDVSFP